MAISLSFSFFISSKNFLFYSSNSDQQWYCIRVIVSRWRKKSNCLGLKATICHLDSANEVTNIKYLFAAFNALTFFSHLDILTVFTNYIWKCIVMTWRKEWKIMKLIKWDYINESTCKSKLNRAINSGLPLICWRGIPWQFHDSFWKFPDNLYQLNRSLTCIKFYFYWIWLIMHDKHALFNPRRPFIGKVSFIKSGTLLAETL